MANELDEMTGPVNKEGRDVNVIEKQIKVEMDTSCKVVNVLCNIGWILIIPGLVWWRKKVDANAYFDKLQQKIQHDASQIDNYLEQRVIILQNVAKLLDKAIDLDKTTFTEIAKNRSAGNLNGAGEAIESVNKAINVQLEAYPELKAHNEIQDALQQNAYLQREITAAREVYNDTVNTWNREIFQPFAKKFVAAKRGLTSRIPYSVSSDVKQAAKGVFF
jgi:LemA protein